MVSVGSLYGFRMLTLLVENYDLLNNMNLFLIN